MYAGIAKLNSDWLLHAEPMASKLAAESLRHDATLRGLLCRHEVAVAVAQPCHTWPCHTWPCHTWRWRGPLPGSC